MDQKKPKPGNRSLMFITSSGLRGRQSVRATFKLSSGCIEAISIVAAQLGIKQKSLFDHLAQDSDSLNAFAGRSKIPGSDLKTAYRRPM